MTRTIAIDTDKYRNVWLLLNGVFTVDITMHLRGTVRLDRD